MYSVILLGVLAAAPVPDQPPPKDEAKKELFAGEQWYKDQKGKEEDFVGALERQPGGGPGIGRFNPYRLTGTRKVIVTVPVKNNGRIEYRQELRIEQYVREVYVGGKPDLLAPYVGKKIKLTGKAVDLEVVGKQHNEIWPARLEVVAAEGKEPPKKSVNEDIKEAQAGKELKVIARAPWRFGVQDGTQHQHIIRSQEELDKVAPKQSDQLLKALKVDKIDFQKQMLIMVSGGAKPTGGWRVEITKVATADKTATVHWMVHKPTGFVTQAFTHPAETILVERFDGTVKFDPPAAPPKEKDK